MMKASFPSKMTRGVPQLMSNTSAPVKAFREEQLSLVWVRSYYANNRDALPSSIFVGATSALKKSTCK